MKNKFYVYEWIRLDNNEPFYIGKGSGRRWSVLTRGNNKHFNNIVKSIPVAVNILEDNLNEEEAYQYECWYINSYIYDFGYDLTNLCDGGEGVTLIGSKNPMFKRTWWDESTPQEKIDEWKKNVANYGENNGNYKRKYTDEQIEKMKKAKKGKFKGKDNPNYGNDALKRKYAENPELKESLIRLGSQNGRSKCVFIYKDDILVNKFDYISACSEWLINKGYTKASVKAISDNITKSIKNNKLYLGFKFSFNEL